MSRRPSTQTNKFNATATADIPRSSFDLSHGLKTTLNSGVLVPILSMEVLPGDSISCRATLFGRVATLIKPILDNLHAETFFFFTPTRQVWDNWVKFHGEQVNPSDSIDFLVPQVVINGATEGDIYDYYGIPTRVAADLSVSALPFRCYNHIYHNWFRDQNIVTAPQRPSGDGPDPSNYYFLRNRRKRKDYFTGCLPWPQKHQDVTISLGQSAPVIPSADAGAVRWDTSAGSDLGEMITSIGTTDLNMNQSQAGSNILHWPQDTQLEADLANAQGISINDLRESIQIQRLLERDARGGSRYPELLRSHFGVSDPMMLVHQRPVFLGGGHTFVNISPVAQTTQSTDEGAGNPNLAPTAQANLAAYGTIQANGHGFTYSATEHGYITGIVNIRADLTYQQGIERYWSRLTRFDYFYPALGHLGEMAVLNKEIYATGTPTDDEVFGYQEAWADYRYIPSKITGEFRSASPTSLDVWHLAQDFATTPALNTAFVEENVPMDRVVAVTDEPEFLLDVYFRIKAARPLPLYGTPGMMDHF